MIQLQIITVSLPQSAIIKAGLELVKPDDDVAQALKTAKRIPCGRGVRVQMTASVLAFAKVAKAVRESNPRLVDRIRAACGKGIAEDDVAAQLALDLRFRASWLPPTGERAKGAPFYFDSAGPFGVPGRDHASALLYLQTVQANYNGDVRAHNGGQHMRWRASSGWDPKYGSRLWDGSVVSDHDDFDCIEDLESLGLLCDEGTGFQPLVSLTEKGHAACAAMIDERSAKRKKA